MRTYDMFLFDADDTLFDYGKAEGNALKTTFDLYGFDYTENIRLKYREINSQLWAGFENGEVTKNELQTLRFLRLFDKIGIDFDAKEFSEKYQIELGKGVFLIDGAFEICKDITSFNRKIYIVTNGVLITQKTRIEYSPIKEYISDLFVSEHIGYQKPSILYFEYVFSHISQVDKSKILIIGDSLSSDIAGGNNAGIDSCWFNKSGKINETGIMPTYEIRELSEVHKFINKF